MIQHSMSHMAFTVPYTEEDVQHEYVTGEATDVYAFFLQMCQRRGGSAFCCATQVPLGRWRAVASCFRRSTVLSCFLRSTARNKLRHRSGSLVGLYGNFLACKSRLPLSVVTTLLICMRDNFHARQQHLATFLICMRDNFHAGQQHIVADLHARQFPCSPTTYSCTCIGPSVCDFRTS